MFDMLKAATRRDPDHDRRRFTTNGGRRGHTQGREGRHTSHDRHERHEGHGRH